MNQNHVYLNRFGIPAYPNDYRLRAIITLGLYYFQNFMKIMCSIFFKKISLNWRKSSIEKKLPFQKLWENLMVRSTSEAICETTGRMMNQHSGKNRHLKPNNFNVEMFLRFNLGPLHKLDGLVAEIFAFNSKKS